MRFEPPQLKWHVSLRSRNTVEEAYMVDELPTEQARFWLAYWPHLSDGDRLTWTHIEPGQDEIEAGGYSRTLRSILAARPRGLG
jgi:hypothetical protein